MESVPVGGCSQIVSLNRPLRTLSGRLAFNTDYRSSWQFLASNPVEVAQRIFSRTPQDIHLDRGAQFRVPIGNLIEAEIANQKDLRD